MLGCAGFSVLRRKTFAGLGIMSSGGPRFSSYCFEVGFPVLFQYVSLGF